MTTLPVRGAGVRELDLPLPPARMPPLRGLRPLKRWRYVAVYAPELMLCVGNARVAGVPQRWWAVALPDGRLFEGRRSPPISLRLGSGRCDRGRLARTARSYIWTRKQAGVFVSGSVRLPDGDHSFEGDYGFVDESAGYHARHTAWRWSAGVGRRSRTAARGLEPGRRGARRSGRERAHRVGRRGAARRWARRRSRRTCRRWATCASASGPRARTTRTCSLMRSDYRQPFGSFSGSLPGGLELESGYGVMEWHDVRW